ncbi:MAG: DegV family protein [Planctomycetes bacterium]|nr:DegV family protein [Planctomycetota bacterium]
MITIVADTTSCIPVQEARALGIQYLPQIIIIGDDTYRDDTEIDSKTFMEKLKTSPVLPKTAAPPPALYTPIFNEYARPGNTIIVVCPSADLSGTFRSAEVAALDFPEADIRVIDTRTVASGLGSIVKKAHEWVQQGLSADQIVDNVKEMSSRWRVYFVVATLEYLHKGGRIGAAKALFGSILQVKPILTVTNGKIEAVESQRTQRRAIRRFQELVYSDCPHDLESHLTMMHAAAENDAISLASEFSKTMQLSEVPITEVPPAIVVHAGPGVLAASYFVKK